MAPNELHVNGDIGRATSEHFGTSPLRLVLTLCAVLLLLFYRNDRLFVAPEFWAEDIDIYFAQDRLFGVGALWLPWNGFVQLICRLFAWLAGLAPAAYGPRIYASLFVLSVFAAAVVTYTSPAFEGWSKSIAALCLVAAPVNSEAFLGMCYTQWVIGPLVGLALYERDPSRGRSVVLLLAFAVTALSSPFVLIAAPFMAYKLITERSVYTWSLAGLTALSAAIHAGPILARFASGASGGHAEIKIDAMTSVLYRWAIGDATSVSQTVIALLSLLTVGLVGLHFWRNRAAAMRPLLYMFAYGAALLVVSCASISASFLSHQYGNFGRYFYIPAVLFLWSCIVAEQNGRHRNSVMLAFCAVLAGSFFAYVDRAGAQYRDTKWADVARCLETEEQCRVGANPAFLGERPMPTDRQLLTMTAEQRRAFKASLENVYPK